MFPRMPPYYASYALIIAMFCTTFFSTMSCSDSEVEDPNKTKDEAKNEEQERQHSENIERLEKLKAVCNSINDAEWKGKSCFNSNTNKEIKLVPAKPPVVLIIADGFAGKGVGANVEKEKSYPEIAKAILKKKGLDLTFIERHWAHVQK